jgi:hypothetical protein
MICKSCSREIPDDSKFCTFCGAVLESTEEAPAIAASDATPTAPGFTSSAPDSAWQSSGTPAPGAPAVAPGAPAPGVPVQPQVTPVSYSAPSAEQQNPAQQQPVASSYAPAPAPMPAPGAPAPTPVQPQQPYGGYTQANPTQPQAQPQQAYSAYGAAIPQPEVKKKSPLPFVLIGAAVVVVLVVVISALSGNTKGWTGGTKSPDLPTGYMAMVDNEHVTIGIGEISYYSYDNTVYAQLYIINRSNYTIYVVFDDNYLDGRYADYNYVWTQIDHTNPNSTSGGGQTDVVWFDTIHNTDDLNNWSGTIYIIDDDTWNDPGGPDILDTYEFDITYVH